MLNGVESGTKEWAETMATVEVAQRRFSTAQSR